MNITLNANSLKTDRAKSPITANINRTQQLRREKFVEKFELPPTDFCGERIRSANRLLAALPVDDYARLAPHLESVYCAAGEQLQSLDKPGDYVYFPETAVISHLCDLADGNTTAVALTGWEGATGICEMLGSRTPEYRAQVTIGGQARRVKIDIFRREFASSGNLQKLLFGFINAHLAQISRRVVCQTFHLIEQRLCRWLLMLQDRVKKNYLTLTQEQIALYFGAHRPSISCAAKILRDKNLINYTRGKVFIVDRPGLVHSACECYSPGSVIL